MMTPPLLFDRELYIARQAKASGEIVGLLHDHVAADLQERLEVISRSFDQVLLIAPSLPELKTCGTIEHRKPSAHDDLGLPPNVFDASISLLDLHCVNDVPGYLAQVSNSLKPDGLALFGFFAGDTLSELRQAWLAAETELTGGVTPRVAPMIDLREAGGLLQRAGLALPVADLDRVTLRYASALTLMNEVKSLGYSNPLHGRRNSLTSQRLLLQVAKHYHETSADADGRIRATIEIAWALAWKPHPSQQQPLKPGSAKARLADALKPV